MDNTIKEYLERTPSSEKLKEALITLQTLVDSGGYSPESVEASKKMIESLIEFKSKF